MHQLTTALKINRVYGAMSFNIMLQCSPLSHPAFCHIILTFVALQYRVVGSVIQIG